VFPYTRLRELNVISSPCAAANERSLRAKSGDHPQGKGFSQLSYHVQLLTPSVSRDVEHPTIIASAASVFAGRLARIESGARGRVVAVSTRGPRVQCWELRRPKSKHASQATYSAESRVSNRWIDVRMMGRSSTTVSQRTR